MSYTLELPPNTEARVQALADAQGLAVEEYLMSLIEDALPAPKPRTGAELVALLKKEGILGMWADRTDIGDSVEYARTLRREAETRGRN